MAGWQDREQARRSGKHDRRHRFSEFKIHNLQARLYGDTGIVVGEGIIKAHKGKQDLLGGKFVGTDTFAKQGGQWKVVASQITPVLEK